MPRTELEMCSPEQNWTENNVIGLKWVKQKMVRICNWPLAHKQIARCMGLARPLFSFVADYIITIDQSVQPSKRCTKHQNSDEPSRRCGHWPSTESPPMCVPRRTLYIIYPTFRPRSNPQPVVVGNKDSSPPHMYRSSDQTLAVPLAMLAQVLLDKQ